jgi:hypothetical protein
VILVPRRIPGGLQSLFVVPASAGCNPKFAVYRRDYERLCSSREAYPENEVFGDLLDEGVDYQF